MFSKKKKKKKSKKTGITLASLVARGKKKKLKSTHSIEKHGKIMRGGAVSDASNKKSAMNTPIAHSLNIDSRNINDKVVPDLG